MLKLVPAALALGAALAFPAGAVPAASHDDELAGSPAAPPGP